MLKVSPFEISGCQDHISLELSGALLLPSGTRLTNPNLDKKNQKIKREGGRERDTETEIPVDIIQLFAPLDSVITEAATSWGFSVMLADSLLFCYFCCFQFELEFFPFTTKESTKKSLKEMMNLTKG